MKLIYDAVDLIEMNLFQDYSLEKLSKDLHYTKYHLSREFNTKIGMSIPEYIKLRRMTESALLLAKDEYKVNDIAFKCGYNSVSYFIKGFKEVFGVTPNQYRKGNHYVQLLRRIDVGGKRMYNNIDELNKYIFNEYSNIDNLNQLFSSFDNAIIRKSEDTTLEFFALLEEEKGNCLWECKLDLLSGISEKSIIAHDKNNPWITMRKLIKNESSVLVECFNEKRGSVHEGELVYIGKSQYLVDMCRIGDEYINAMDHYIDEKPSHEAIERMIEEVEELFKCKNNFEIKDLINSKNQIELVRLVNKKALIVYLINNISTFTVFDVLLNLEDKTFSYNFNSGFNNFDKVGTVKWEGKLLQVQLDGKYFAELRLGTGELYKLYNSCYAIEFDNQRRGLSSISFETKK